MYRFKIFFSHLDGTQDEAIIEEESMDAIRKKVDDFLKIRGLNLKDHYNGSEQLGEENEHIKKNL